MLEHPRALAGLSDAGAARRHGLRRELLDLHADALGAGSRQRRRLPLERAVEMMTSRNARYLGLADRAGSRRVCAPTST
jgi:N-acyl-D-aspartate/D-glutamate deacylase